MICQLERINSYLESIKNRKKKNNRCNLGRVARRSATWSSSWKL